MGSWWQAYPSPTLPHVATPSPQMPQKQKERLPVGSAIWVSVCTPAFKNTRHSINLKENRKYMGACKYMYSVALACDIFKFVSCVV